MTVNLISFSPGGGIVSTHAVIKHSDEGQVEMVARVGRFMASKEAQQNFKEYHTRNMRNLFKRKLENIASGILIHCFLYWWTAATLIWSFRYNYNYFSVQPAVADLIYKELCLDASQAYHPVTQDRIRLIFMGNEGLIRDLRSLNPGRPGNKYDTFFEEMAKVITLCKSSISFNVSFSNDSTIQYDFYSSNIFICLIL